MITPLRRRHRWMAPTLLLAGGATLLAAGVLSKPGSASADAVGNGFPQLAGSASIADHSSGRFRVAATGGSSGRLWLLPFEPLDIPDLLVYGLSEAADPTGLEGEPLPETAVLLGPASGVRPTSWDCDPFPATLVLFSLAHQSVAAAIEVPR